MRTLLLIAALALAAPTVLAQDTPDPSSDAYAESDLVATLESQGSFTVLVDALRSTGLDAALASSETYTVFAPTDDAFAALPAGTLDALSADELVALLRRHVAAGAVPASEAVGLASVPTVGGDVLSLDSSDGALRIEGAAVVEPDIAASNGVIHVIDAVLVPTPEGDDSMDEMDGFEEDAMDQMEDERAPEEGDAGESSSDAGVSSPADDQH